ncbi:MAG TPA: chemotaxis protein CheB [Verrucomicrobiae bacterium]|jgi:two-component system CheB/CheR fusion protein
MAKKSKRASPRLKTAGAGAQDIGVEAKILKASVERVEQTADEVHRAIERTHKNLEIVHKKTLRRKLSGALPRSFPIVGIGASAGGLEAVTQLLEDLPADTGMAFVVVQHLDPTHESALAQLLARATDMPVVEAKNNLRLEANRVHVIPPNKTITLAQKRLKLSPRRDGQENRLPIDHFLCSLAEEEGADSIGIILSGNGSDGTAGLQAVKAAGGIVFAQDNKSAKFQPMPASAIASGCVDFVMPPQKMAAELTRIAKQLREAPAVPEHEMGQPEKAFEEILILLRQRTAVDFTFYKHATIRRRLHRRMMLHKMESMKDYCGYLRSHAAEIEELFNDILIHVTGFFRDTAVFRILRKKTFPRLLRGKSRNEAIRIWIPGCSTGEEIYSLAISLLEAMNDKKVHHAVQIFGTDINDKGLERARVGIYPESIQADVSQERLRKFFTRREGGFRVNKTIREMCIFARQNLAMDPPFSNLDLISCRNVLIYLGPMLQRKVLPTFHYALRPGGLLMLGVSETVGVFSDLFALVDNKAKIYSKKSVQTPVVRFSPAISGAKIFSDGDLSGAAQMTPAIPDVQRQADRIVLTGYSPAGVIINKHLEVLQFRGRTGLFLEHPHGEASFNLLKMTREGLLLALRATIARAMKDNTRARQERVRVRQNGHSLECTIEVIPFSVPPSPEKFYLVLFGSKTVSVVKEKKKLPGGKPFSARVSDGRELANLREELAATRDSLQTIIEEQEATNEELRSANEEIMSSNEELQSTNEELETAKEELQSTNEELTTLNDELESRNAELEQVNNDLHNLLASVNIPVIILNSDLRIRRFTLMAEKLFKLIPADIGRPITDIAIPLEISDLERQVRDVLESLAPKDFEKRDKNGRWWSVRIRAYKTTEHKIDGVVIALMDIDLLKGNMEKISRGRDYAEAIVNTVREPLLVLDDKLIVKSANEVFYRKFKTAAEDTIDWRIYELGNGQWNIPRLRTLLEEILVTNSSFNDFEVEHTFPAIGKKKMLLNARRLNFQDGGGEMILLAIEDIPVK